MLPFFIIIWAILSLGCNTLSPERSTHVRLITKNGDSIYVNRLARGVTYDKVWITANSGKCRTPQKEDIYMGDSPIYYKEMPDGTITFINTWEVEIPEGFPDTVKWEIIHPMDYHKVNERYESGEIKKLTLDLPVTDTCLVRWTEIKDIFQ